MGECKKCLSTDVQKRVNLETLYYKDIELLYQLTFSVCNNCGREFVSTDQIRVNDDNVRKAKFSYLGKLSAIDDAETVVDLRYPNCGLVETYIYTGYACMDTMVECIYCDYNIRVEYEIDCLL